MMKVTAITSSPRKHGNTQTIVGSILAEAQRSGYETAHFDLSSIVFSDCQACNYCKTAAGCRQKDGLTDVLQAIADSDAVVFASPIYFWQMNGTFRSFEDRLFSFLGPGFQSKLKPGKKAIIITSQGNGDPKTFQGVADEFSKVLTMLGFNIVDTIQMYDGNSPNAVEAKPEVLQKAMTAAAAL